MLDDVTRSLILEKEKFNAVQEAVAFENNKLKELYEIEVSAGSLEALIVSQQAKEEFEKEMAEEKETLKKRFELKGLNGSASKKINYVKKRKKKTS